MNAEHPPQHDDALIPEIGAIPQVVRMFRVRWVSALQRSPAGVPLHGPEFVAGLGRAGLIVDVREGDELVGPLGHVPGSAWVPFSQIDTIAERLHRDAPLVLVSRAGELAAEAALRLERAGMRLVSSMQGGMVGWRQLGFAVSREAAILAHRGELALSDDPCAQPVRVMEPGHYNKPGEAGAASVSGPRTLDREHIAQHVGDVSLVRWIKLAGLLLHGRMSCVDGRDDGGVIGTPGGDMGEFVLMLAAIERVLDRTLDPPEIERLLARRVDTFGRFYVHTDVAASNRFIASLRGDARLNDALAGVWDPLQWRRFLSHPPEAVREIVLSHMLQPAHLGCGHLRRMSESAAQYDVRAGLVTDVVRAFFHLRWQGASELEYLPLAGGHKEAAVANVRVHSTLQPFTWVPLVSPSVGAEQMFVNHPQVAAYLREQSTYFLEQQSDLLSLPRGGREAIARELTQLGEKHLATTLGFLAKGLPVYDITFGSGGQVTIEHTGTVA